MSGGEITPEQFAVTFRRVAEWAHAEGYQERSPFKAMLTDHFGSDPATFPVTAESIASYDLPNLQLARSAAPRVDDSHFAQALDLLERGGRITRTMLGGDGGRALGGLPDDDEDGWEG